MTNGSRQNSSFPAKWDEKQANRHGKLSAQHCRVSAELELICAAAASPRFFIPGEVERSYHGSHGGPRPHGYDARRAAQVCREGARIGRGQRGRYRTTSATASLQANIAGLTDADAVKYQKSPDGGFNELPDKKKNKIIMFLSYLWGPMPIAIWVAVIIEVIRAAIAQEDYEGFIVLLILQFANAVVGFIEESKAGDAIAALRSQLAPKAHVLRNGKWQDRFARELVPGDIAQLKIGDIIPADGILLEGQPIQARGGERGGGGGVVAACRCPRCAPCRRTRLR